MNIELYRMGINVYYAKNLTRVFIGSSWNSLFKHGHKIHNTSLTKLYGSPMHDYASNQLSSKR